MGNVAEQRYNGEAPYRSPEHAVQIAYQLEAQDIVKVSSYFAQLRGGSVKMRRGIDRFDLHAQAAIILAVLGRWLEPHELVVVRGRHTVPTTPVLTRRKNVDAKLLYHLAIDGRSDAPDIDKRYAADVLRQWMGGRRKHDDDWWSRKTRKDIVILRRWRLGRPERGAVGFVRMLDIYHSNAMERLVEPMFEAGLTRS